MKLKALHLASMAGIDVYSAWGVADNAIERFAKLIIEECATCVENLQPEHTLHNHYDRYIASEIRNLMED